MCLGLSNHANGHQIRCVIVWSICLHDVEFDNVGMSREFSFPDCSFLCLVSDIDYCNNVTCKNGGSCVDGIDKYKCSCSAGFSGDHCETGIAGIRIMLVKTIKSQRHKEDNAMK